MHNDGRRRLRWLRRGSGRWRRVAEQIGEIERAILEISDLREGILQRDFIEVPAPLKIEESWKSDVKLAE